MACLYGDILKIDTTGASEQTARQDKLTIQGVQASVKLAEIDLVRIEKYKSVIIKVARAKQMDAAVIAAIISRESRAGAILKNGWGDQGNAFGLMQVKKSYHTPTGGWDSELHIIQATDILITRIKEIKVRFPKWTQEQCFKAGISAYNVGVESIQNYEEIDIGTPGQDYANDVIARAQWFRNQGY